MLLPLSAVGAVVAAASPERCRCCCWLCPQARVAVLLKDNPSAGQAFCRLLVAPYINYIEGGKGEDDMLSAA